MAYADDLVIQGEDTEELGDLIIELESLDEVWNLTVNHSKSEILAVNETIVSPIRGI